MALTRIITLTAAASLALSACTSTSAPTNTPNQRTKEGAAAGAIAGGGLGALVGGKDRGERTRGALAGAVIGGGLGAAIGNSLDKQAEELQRDLGNGRIQILNNGDHLVVRMPDDILFDVGSAEVKPSLRSDLGVLAQNLQSYPNSTIQVVGHTDNTGAASFNQDLSERRAGSVSSVLIGSGVAAGRINSFGQGESQPIGSNLTPEGRAQNRRVDITIRPNA